MDFKWNYLLADGRDARFICFKCFEGRGSMINAQFAFRASSLVIGQFSINETKSIGFVCIVVEKRGEKAFVINIPPSSTLPRNTSRPRVSNSIVVAQKNWDRVRACSSFLRISTTQFRRFFFVTRRKDSQKKDIVTSVISLHRQK